MSKKCPNCGTELEDNALFCDECGAQLNQQTESLSTTSTASPAVPPTNSQKPKYSDINSKSANEPKAADGMKNSGLGIAAMIIGIISICTLGCFFMPEILGLILGIVAMFDKTKKHDFAIVGIITSAISFVIVIVLLII
ncbi:MAG: zinc ribbon domain-containing protein [Clostridiales bacterium]|nr:zinc ribbon domain-containing protein [Clostridiales bacterium]